MQSLQTDAELRIQELERAQEHDAIRIHELSSALEVEIIASLNYERAFADVIKRIDGVLAENLGL